MMRFLRADSNSVTHDDKGKGKSTGLGRSASYAQVEQQMSRPTSPPSDHFSYLPTTAGIDSTPAHHGTSEQYYEQPMSAPSKTVKLRPSLEDIVERSADRRKPGKGRNLQQWSESRENDYSGDEQGAEVSVDQSRPYGDAPTYSNLPTPHSNRVSHLSHNESPTYSASGSPAMQHHVPRQPLSAHRGMMERFMCDREKVEDFQQGPVESAALSFDHPMHHQQYSPSMLLPRNPTPSHSSIFAASPMPTSPTSSRPTGKDLLCSPDVARLLRSELNELAVQSRRRSVEGDIEVGAEEDLAEEKSSPYTSQLEYGDTDYSPGYSNAKRGRNTYHDGAESTKRSRWNDTPAGDNRRVVSPCPSNASMPLRAPSFCDSSPAVSERSHVDHRHYPISLPMTHSVSAPDFSYQTHQSSSSPASSQSLSDYTPGTKRRDSQLLSSSSGASRRSDDIQISYENAPIRKRGPIKRTDSSPGSAIDGHAKPPWSYAALIGQAVYSTETSRISLADIYSFIMTSYPYYKKEDSGWQNSIRHNLSLNDCFVKTARGDHNPGKGCLWAVAVGCEDQFNGGGFIKKGSTTTTKKKRATSRAEPAATRAKRIVPVEVSPSSSRASSPASIAAMSAPRSKAPVASQPSPLATMAPLRKISPIPQVEADIFSPRPPTPTLPAPYSQPAASTSENYPPRAGLHRRHTSISLQSIPQEAPIMQRKVSLAPAYELRPVPATGSAPPSVQKAAARDIFASPVLASPPTSVYNRLAGPYQPLGYSLSSAQNHRALALLASPEAAGIMPVHPSVYTTRSIVPSSAGLPPTPFPPLSIFPSTGRTRQPTSEFSTASSPQPLSTRSPISSLRHSSLDDKHITLPSLDPEKRSYHTSPKRNRSHLPSVAALAAESMTPPRHLRSPTGGHSRTRSIGTLTALHGTPGGRVGWNDPFGGNLEELNPYDRNVQTGFWPSPTGPQSTMW